MLHLGRPGLGHQAIMGSIGSSLEISEFRFSIFQIMWLLVPKTYLGLGLVLFSCQAGILPELISPTSAPWSG